MGPRKPGRESVARAHRISKMGLELWWAGSMSSQDAQALLWSWSGLLKHGIGLITRLKRPLLTPADLFFSRIAQASPKAENLRRR
jgi:hypothetical protein